MWLTQTYGRPIQRFEPKLELIMVETTCGRPMLRPPTHLKTNAPSLLCYCLLAISRPPCPSAVVLSCSSVHLTLRCCPCAVLATTSALSFSQHILHPRPQHGFRFPIILFRVLPLARRQPLLVSLPFPIARAIPLSSTRSTFPASVLQLHVHPGLRRTVYCTTLLPTRRVPTC